MGRDCDIDSGAQERFGIDPVPFDRPMEDRPPCVQVLEALAERGLLLKFMHEKLHRALQLRKS